MDISDRLRILEGLGYYGSGGGKKSSGQQIAELFSGIGGGLANYAKGADLAADRKKKLQEGRKIELENTPVGDLYDIPSSEQESGMKALFDGQQATRPGLQGPQPQSGPQLDLTPPEPQKFESPRQGFEKNYGVSPDLPLGMYKDFSTAKAANSYLFVSPEGKTASSWFPGAVPVPQNKAGSEALKGGRLGLNPMNKTIAEALPSMDQAQIEKTFGAGVTKDTNFTVASRLSGQNRKAEAAGRLFPISGLSPEAQAAAGRAGLGPLVPESTARILNAGNLPRPATAEEIKDAASFDTMSTEIQQIRDLVEKTKYSGIGVENYYINALGQYSPIDSLKTNPDVVQLYQLINDVNNKMIYLQSGKQINESEFKRLKAVFPEPQLNPEAFKTRLDTFSSTFGELNANRNKQMTAAQRRGGMTGQGGPGPSPSTSRIDAFINDPATTVAERETIKAKRKSGVTDDQIMKALGL